VDSKAPRRGGGISTVQHNPSQRRRYLSKRGSDKVQRFWVKGKVPERKAKKFCCPTGKSVSPLRKTESRGNHLRPQRPEEVKGSNGHEGGAAPPPPGDLRVSTV